MSKQLTLQIGSLVVLVIVGGLLLWKLPPVPEPAAEVWTEFNELGTVDFTNAGIEEDQNSFDDDPLINRYVAEGYPTATELSPDLRTLMISLFTQTDVFAVIDEMPFGDSGERAVIATTIPNLVADPRVCGVDGQPLCILFYQYSDGSVEIYDVYQAFDPAFDSYYEYAPEILDILSMPYSGDVLVGGFIPFAMGKDTMRYDIANASGRTNVINITTTDGQKFHYASASADLALDARVEVIASDDDDEFTVRVTVSDAQQTLLTVDSPSKPWALGVLTSSNGPLGVDPKATYTQQSIYFTLFKKNYVYGRSLNEKGETIYTLDEIE